MKFTFKSFFLSCLVAATAFRFNAVAKPKALHHEDYAREVLFSLPYGPKNNQVGLIWQPQDAGVGVGIRGLQVARDGRIVIGDNVNNCVKAFNSRGRYLFRTQGVLDGIENVTMNRAGEIFVVSGSDRVISKFSSKGKLLWKVSDQKLPQRFAETRSVFLPYLDLIPRGGIAVVTTTRGANSESALFDNQGRFQRFLTQGFPTENGLIYQLSKAPTKDNLAIQARVSDIAGKQRLGLLLQPGSRFKGLFVSTDGSPSLGPLSVAPNGTLYTVGEVLLHTNVEILRGYKTSHYAVVVSYSPSGKPFAALRCLAEPFRGASNSFTMDAQNNVYTIEYTPKALRVVRYRLKPQFQPR